ncbi:hypothetical protein F442_20423 [Phytophthora nicotianae P10297]|uniref:Uncharacterized protein n=1 Tax=Phytophthora nicotianae P10297 TaxID=1317064 RepID=W2Y8V3_PHYNI|nr:hypothetical protein F442_20423 [Phytophthora nicotianae P10297]
MVWGIFDILQASKKVSDPFKFDISSYLQDKLSDKGQSVGSVQ